MAAAGGNDPTRAESVITAAEFGRRHIPALKELHRNRPGRIDKYIVIMTSCLTMNDKRTCELLCEEVIRNVRLAFHQLKAFGDRLHGSLGITSSMRGVMESLAEGGPQTVSQMARARPVSRQHIQALVNELMAAGLAEAHGNPAHKRSPLLVLTATGLKHFTEMRQREQGVLAVLTKKLPAKDLSITLGSLKRLRGTLAQLTEPPVRRTKQRR